MSQQTPDEPRKPQPGSQVPAARPIPEAEDEYEGYEAQAPAARGNCLWLIVGPIGCVILLCIMLAVPIIFGLLTTHTVAQAIERAEPTKFNRGGEAARSAIEMATVMRLLRVGEETQPGADVPRVRGAKKRAPRKRKA
jgi:hypothetical protein